MFPASAGLPAVKPFCCVCCLFCSATSNALVLAVVLLWLVMLTALMTRQQHKQLSCMSFLYICSNHRHQGSLQVQDCTPIPASELLLFCHLPAGAALSSRASTPGQTCRILGRQQCPILHRLRTFWTCNPYSSTSCGCCWNWIQSGECGNHSGARC